MSVRRLAFTKRVKDIITEITLHDSLWTLVFNDTNEVPQTGVGSSCKWDVKILRLSTNDSLYIDIVTRQTNNIYERYTLSNDDTANDLDWS